MGNSPSIWQRTLLSIERAGNHLPLPAVLFIYMCLIMLVISWIGASLGAQVTLPGDDRVVVARSLLSGEGIRWILENTVDNFVNFAPVGVVLVSILGIGVAEHSGLLRVLLTRLVLWAPDKLLTWIVVLAGILSSIAADVGYVVLIPLAAMLFAASGRPPLGGIAAAFAGVSAGFSANLMIGPLDAVLAGLSTEAVAVVATDYQVSIAANYYFLLASTLVLSLVGAWVTEALILPWLARQGGRDEQVQVALEPLTDGDRQGLWAVLAWTLGFGLLLLIGVLPQNGLLRHPGGGVLDSAFMQGMVVVIALYAAVAGWIFGRVSGRYRKSNEAIAGMESAMETMATYLVLMFFAAQFVNYFAWSQLGTIVAVSGANLLQGLALSPALLLMLFVLMAACINLFIGSATAKWALIGPVFVPMLYLLGISPEATQMAYRIGDSTTNIITPLMPYFGVVVAFAQRYRKDVGIGTLLAMMLPYSVIFLAVWSGLLLGWIWLDWPLGPGAPILLP